MNHQLIILLIRQIQVRLRLSTWGPAILLRGSRGAAAWQCERRCQGHPQVNTVQLPRPSRAIRSSDSTLYSSFRHPESPILGSAALG